MSIATTLHKTATGNYWLPDAPQCGICTDIREGRVYDAYVVDALRPYIKPGSTVVDLGACYGQMSVIFSSLVWTLGKVVAVEANKDLFEIVEHNLKENNCVQAQAIHAAAWYKSGDVLKFPNANLNHPQYKCYGCWGLAAAPIFGSHDVPALAVDDLHLGDVSAIKVDVQGADLHAMRGCVETIWRCRPAIIYEIEPQLTEALGTPVQAYDEFVKSINYVVAKQFGNWNFLILPA
jgi:FkbM family methyltransferase